MNSARFGTRWFGVLMVMSSSPTSTNHCSLGNSFRFQANSPQTIGRIAKLHYDSNVITVHCCPLDSIINANIFAQRTPRKAIFTHLNHCKPVNAKDD